MKEQKMTNEELAKHWRFPQKEVERISALINDRYKLDILPTTEDSAKLWQGVMYAYDPHNKYILMESKDRFISRDQAILHWSRQIRNMKLTNGQAALMGVPVDAFRTIKPVDGYERVLKEATTPVILFGNFSKRQHN